MITQILPPNKLTDNQKKQLINGAPTIPRAAMADTLTALLYAHRNMVNLMQPESYPAGYLDGFEAAIITVGRVIGVDLSEVK